MHRINWIGRGHVRSVVGETELRASTDPSRELSVLRSPQLLPRSLL